MEDNSISDSEDPKKKLDQLLNSAVEKGNLIAKTGRKVTEEGQNMSDVASATRDVIKTARYVPDIETSISYWEEANQQADNFLSQNSERLISPLISGSATATYNSTSLTLSSDIYFDVPDDDKPVLSAAILNLSNIVSRSSHEDEVINLMKSLGLDTSREGKKSPLELFKTAHESFSKPVNDSNPISTSLLPMRESINLSVDYLIKRRRKQEKAKSQWSKIISIGNQLSYSTISQQQIRSWAAIWVSELDVSLSPAKEEDILRDEWSKRLIRSTLFLKSFLSGIDPAKLR
jgi:hypothetical protein